MDRKQWHINNVDEHLKSLRDELVMAQAQRLDFASFVSAIVLNREQTVAVEDEAMTLILSSD